MNDSDIVIGTILIRLLLSYGGSRSRIQIHPSRSRTLVSALTQAQRLNDLY